MASSHGNARWRGLVLLAALLVQLALLWVYYQPAAKGLAGDERSYLHSAKVIRDGARPEPGLWPPLYPRLLAWLGATADDPSSLARVQAVQVALLVAAAFLVTAIARRVLGPGPGATLAGVLMVSYPPLVAYTHYLWPEVVHLVLFLGAVWIVVARHRAMRWMPVLGIALGLALSSKSLLLPFVPVLMLALLRGTDRAAARWRALVAAVCLAATLTPAAVVSYRTTGTLSLSGSAWFNIWAGLQDTSRRSLREPVVGKVYRAYRAAGDHPRARDAVARDGVRSILEDRGLFATLTGQLGRQYFRLFDKDSYLTAQLPGAHLARMGQGYQGQPGPLTHLLRWSSYALYGAILLAAVIGVVVVRPRDPIAHRLILAFVAYNLLLFLILHVKSRYRIQMLPFFFLYAGAWVDWLRARLHAPTETPALVGGRRWWVLSASVVVLFLAFGAAWLDA